jgi:hypothetical protein
LDALTDHLRNSQTTILIRSSVGSADYIPYPKKLLFLRYNHKMKLKQYLLTVIMFSIAAAMAQQPTKKFAGQGPIQGVSTESRPVEKQWKGITPFENEQVFFSNDFTGARLNKVTETGSQAYNIRIEPENTPVNASPWYAFKVWAKRHGLIRLSFSYPDKVKHRYEPKISHDGQRWEQLAFKDENGVQTYEIDISKDTIWIAA